MQKRNVKVLVILVLGLLLGVASSYADTLPFGTALFILGGFLNTASVWSFCAFLIGTKFRSRKNSILASTIFLSLSVIGYYSFGYFLGNRSEVPFITIFVTSFSWLIIALFVGTLCGLAGRTAKYTKDLKKRMLAIVIPMVIIITESIIAIIQILPYLNSNNSNYIPFGVMISLILSAFAIPFFIFNNKRVALYTMILGILLSLLGSILLMAVSNA